MINKNRDCSCETRLTYDTYSFFMISPLRLIRLARGRLPELRGSYSRVEDFSSRIVGEPEHDGRARAWRTLDRDRSAMEREDGLHNRQSKPEALRMLRPRAIGAIKTVEDAWQMFGIDPRSRIGDTDVNPSIAGARHRDQ